MHLFFSLYVSQFPYYLLPYGVSEGRLGLSWLGKPEGTDELSGTQDTYLLSYNTDCLPSLSVGFLPISILCRQFTAYLSLQPHIPYPQPFWVSLAIPHSKNAHMHQHLSTEEHRKWNKRPLVFPERNLYRRSGVCGGGGIGGHCDENWTTLLAWVAFVFSLPRVPAVQCGAGWQARGKGPICCMRLFQTRYSTGCHLFGETQGRWDYGEEGMYACVGGGYGGEFLKTTCVCLMWFYMSVCASASL